MFCKYCGKAIDEGTMRCRICGRPVGPLEGGNGFWDLKEERRSETPAAESAAESAPTPAPEAEPVLTPAPAASAEGIPTAAAASPADSKAIRELRSSVKKLQEQVRELTPQRRGALTGGAVLLALLALALGVFVLFQLRALTGKVQELELQLAKVQAVGAAGQDAGDGGPEGAGAGEQSDAESKWLGFDPLDGIRLFSRQDLFEGPNKGKDDLRGQSIKLGLPDNGYEETPIFTARYLGPAGTYLYYWVKVETNDETKEVYFTPLKEEDGYGFRKPNASDTNKTYVLSILGEVKEEHLGRYAFVAVDTQTLSAYVSGIVELYDRAEQGQEGPWSEGAAQARENGAGNGN
jgi:hypothetical protein